MAVQRRRSGAAANRGGRARAARPSSSGERRERIHEVAVEETGAVDDDHPALARAPQDGQAAERVEPPRAGELPDRDHRSDAATEPERVGLQAKVDALEKSYRVLSDRKALAEIEAIEIDDRDLASCSRSSRQSQRIVSTRQHGAARMATVTGDQDRSAGIRCRGGDRAPSTAGSLADTARHWACRRWPRR